MPGADKVTPLHSANIITPFLANRYIANLIIHDNGECCSGFQVADSLQPVYHRWHDIEATRLTHERRNGKSVKQIIRFFLGCLPQAIMRLQIAVNSSYCGKSVTKHQKMPCLIIGGKKSVSLEIMQKAVRSVTAGHIQRQIICV